MLMSNMKLLLKEDSNRDFWKTHFLNDFIAIRWLGQSGFAINFGKIHAMIDPYLSDSLAIKYKGKEFPHIRMMPIPVCPAEIQGLNVVICTHRHSDHMDPGTLPILEENNPQCKFILPRVDLEWATTFLSISKRKILAINAGESVRIEQELEVIALVAAHEELKVNNKGEHHFLGYIMRFNNFTIYHSGDCVPYPGLIEMVARHQVDLALLPVNGRNAQRLSNNIPGNFFLEEALDLCKRTGIKIMIAHHFGMFDFNTVDESELKLKVKMLSKNIKCFIPSTDRWYIILKK